MRTLPDIALRQRAKSLLGSAPGHLAFLTLYDPSNLPFLVLKSSLTIFYQEKRRKFFGFQRIV